MAGGAPTDIVIPAGQVGRAMGDLRDHILMIHDASMWLYCEGDHSPAAYLAILCMEEISKYHVLDSRKRGGEGVTVGDTCAWRSHRKKILSFLRKMHGISGTNSQDPAGGRQCPADYSQVAAKLNFVKQLAVYHEYIGGKAVTLGGLLGRDALFRASTHLQHVACQGVATISAPSCGRQGSSGAQDRGGSGGDIDSGIAAVMEALHGVPAGNGPKGGTGLPLGSLDAILAGLEQHIGDLDICAVKLQRSFHHVASIFMSIISFEEANKYHVIARRRRRGQAVTAKDMGLLADHKAKLTAFLDDVSRYQEGQNRVAATGPTRRYHTVDPWALWGLNGVKQVSMYFAHIRGRTVTLERLLGFGPGAMALYLRKTLMGMVSWAILCDGDTDDPYTVHGTNPVHARRLKALVDFKTDERCREFDEEMYYMIGLLDGLNGAMWRHDEALCEETLSIIEGIR